MREPDHRDHTPEIIHVFPSFARGGQQMRLANVVRGLGAAFSHRVISLDGDISAKDAFPEGMITVERFPARKSRGLSLSNVSGLARRIRGGDLLCTYNFGALEAAIANRIGRGLPHLHFEDGFGADEDITRQKWRRVQLRRLILANSLVVVPSQGLERLALEKWRLSRARVRRIVNGVDVDRFANIGRTRAPNAPGAPVVVGSLGALRPEKNYLRLIGAFSMAASEQAASLVIYGDGPQRDRLSVLAGKADCTIELRGETRSPETALAEFDIFALSSDTEQAPLALMEAMAAGLPVAATDVGDVRAMLSEENHAFITPAGDEAALAGALARLIADPQLRTLLGAANAARARAEFGLERMISAYRSLFGEALERRAR